MNKKLDIMNVALTDVMPQSDVPIPGTSGGSLQAKPFPGDLWEFDMPDGSTHFVDDAGNIVQ